MLSFKPESDHIRNRAFEKWPAEACGFASGLTWVRN